MAIYVQDEIQLVKPGDKLYFNKLKPCPYRIRGERRASLTIEGEYYYNEYFMPCMRQECGCFHVDCGDAYCDRNGSYMKLGELKESKEEDK